MLAGGSLMRYTLSRSQLRFCTLSDMRGLPSKATCHFHSGGVHSTAGVTTHRLYIIELLFIELEFHYLHDAKLQHALLVLPDSLLPLELILGGLLGSWGHRLFFRRIGALAGGNLWWWGAGPYCWATVLQATK